MKKLITLIGITLLSLMIAPASQAQNEEAEKSYHKHWERADSAFKHDYDGLFDDFNFSDFPFSKKKKKYNGHWAGFELGMGGYVTSSFDMNFGPKYPWMNMNTARSLLVNFNLYELNVNITDQHLGFTTGFGFQVNNYFFTDHYVMISDSATLVAYKVQDVNGNPVRLEKNKMVASYFTVPLLLEYQTNAYRRSSSFHIAAGIVASARIGSYTKQEYPQKSGTLYLVDEKGNPVAGFGISDNKVRTRAPYHLSPFKVDATVRIGWSHLNLFGTFSLTQMFQKNQGPEVYPFTVGLTLLSW